MQFSVTKHWRYSHPRFCNSSFYFLLTSDYCDLEAWNLILLQVKRLFSKIANSHLPFLPYPQQQSERMLPLKQLWDTSLGFRWTICELYVLCEHHLNSHVWKLKLFPFFCFLVSLYFCTDSSVCKFQILVIA